MARRTLSLPSQYNLVGNRFVVIIRDGLSWLDLDQPDSDWKKIDTLLVPILDPANQPGLGLIQPWNSGYRQSPRPRSFNSLINIDQQTVLATRIVSNSIVQLSLFRFDDQGNLRPLAAWPALNGNFSVFDSLVASIDPTTSQLEIRGSQDGTVVRTVKFPADTFPQSNPAALVANNGWHFHDGLMCIQRDGSWSYYDMRRRQWLRSPDQQLPQQVYDSELKLSSFLSGQDLVIFDQQSSTVRFTLPDCARHLAFFLDRQTTVLVDWRFGGRFHFYDNNTGRLAGTYAPFQWLPAGILMLLAVFAGWCVLWLRASARAAWWVWWDVLLILGGPGCVLSYRVAQGPTWDLSHPVISYAMGIALGIATVGSLWLTRPARRWPMRLMPLLLLQACLLCNFRWLFGQDYQLIAVGLLNVIAPVILLVLIFFALKLVGMHWQRALLHQPSQPVEASQLAHTRLSDLFLLILVVAVVLAAAGTLIRNFNSVKLSTNQVEMIIVAIGVIWVLFTVVSCFSTNGRLFRLICWLQVICLLSLIADSVYGFATDTHWQSYWTYSVHVRSILAAGLSVWIASWIFRLRGYRWSRSSSAGKDLSSASSSIPALSS